MPIPGWGTNAETRWAETHTTSRWNWTQMRQMSVCTGDNLENFMAEEHSCDWDHISKIGEESTSMFSSHIAAIITSSHLQLAGRLHPMLPDTDLALSFSHFGHLVVLQKTDIPGHEAFNTWETPNSTTCYRKPLQWFHCHRYILSIAVYSRFRVLVWRHSRFWLLSFWFFLAWS